jgi:hypothetical protein
MLIEIIRTTAEQSRCSVVKDREQHGGDYRGDYREEEALTKILVAKLITVDVGAHSNHLIQFVYRKFVFSHW